MSFAYIGEDARKIASILPSMIDAYIVTLPQPPRPTILYECVVIPLTRNLKPITQKSIHSKMFEEHLRIFYSSSITHDILSSLGEPRISSQSVPSSKTGVPFSSRPHFLFVLFLSVLYLIV